MKKVLIFDYGFSGLKLGNIIETELPVEVKKVILGGDKELHCKTNWEIIEETKEALLPFIDKVDVIVLSNPTVAMIVKDYLQLEFPEQKFVGYGWDLPELIHKMRGILILMPDKVRKTECYQKLKAECQQTKINESNSEKWIDMVQSECCLEDTDFKREVDEMAHGKVIVCNSSLVLMEKRLKEKIGWRAEVLDLFDTMLNNLKLILELK